MEEVVIADSRGQEARLGEELAMVISSEITVKVLVDLVERTASPKEIAARLGLKTANVSHHVKKLKRMNLVELIEEREVGGTIQHIYRAVVRPVFSTEEWSKLSIAERQRYSIWIVRMLLADAAKSFNARLFDTHANRHLSRIPMVVDETGLDEVAAIQNRALNEIVEVEAKSAERMARSDEQAMNIIAAMMCFEIPGLTDGLKRGDADQI